MSTYAKLHELLANEASKSAFVRRRLPSLQDRFVRYVNGHPQREKFLAGHPVRLAKGLWQRVAFWRSAPAHFSGGLILNLLGLHVVRCAVHRKLRAAGAVEPAFSALRDNGVMRVDNLLAPHEVETVRMFYEQHAGLRKVYLPDFSELIIYSNLLTYDNDNFERADFRQMREFIVRTLDLPKLFRAMSGKALRSEPFISVIHHKHLMSGDHTPQQDGNNLPHRDVFYPSYKIFIYLNDVSEDNAAFIYYPGTHRSPHWRDAYRSSLRYYWVEKRANKPVNALDHCQAAPQPISQVGAAGSAVIFNVAGIHRRGEYKRDQFRERIVLLIDFRQNDAWFIPRAHRWKGLQC
jgi:Phytanoyl-CoA dioxygenase (PhyH)